MTWAIAQGRAVARIAFQAQFDFESDRNPPELLDLAREFPDAANVMTLRYAAAQLAGQGLDGYRRIAEFTPGIVRDRMFSIFATALSQADPKAALELMQSLPLADRNALAKSVRFEELAKVAPEAAAKLALDARPDDVSDAVTEWSRSDPRAALSWSARNLNGIRLLDAVGASVAVWAENDPAAAAWAIDGLAPGMRAKVLPRLLTTWAQKDPKTAFTYAEQLPLIDRQRATGSVIEGWAETDPLAAADALAKVPVVGMGDAYEAVSWKLLDRDPAQAMTWAASIADSGEGSAAARRVAQSWARTDAAAAADRLAELKPNGFRDNAVAGFVTAVCDLDPKSAADWANSIGLQGMRENQVRIVLQSWKGKDREGARAFVNALKPGSWQEQMRQLVEK